MSIPALPSLVSRHIGPRAFHPALLPLTTSHIFLALFLHHLAASHVGLVSCASFAPFQAFQAGAEGAATATSEPRATSKSGVPAADNFGPFQGAAANAGMNTGPATNHQLQQKPAAPLPDQQPRTQLHLAAPPKPQSPVLRAASSGTTSSGVLGNVYAGGQVDDPKSDAINVEVDEFVMLHSPRTPAASSPRSCASDWLDVAPEQGNFLCSSPEPEGTSCRSELAGAPAMGRSSSGSCDSQDSELNLLGDALLQRRTSTTSTSGAGCCGASADSKNPNEELENKFQSCRVRGTRRRLYDCPTSSSSNCSSVDVDEVHDTVVGKDAGHRRKELVLSCSSRGSVAPQQASASISSSLASVARSTLQLPVPGTGKGADAAVAAAGEVQDDPQAAAAKGELQAYISSKAPLGNALPFTSLGTTTTPRMIGKKRMDMDMELDSLQDHKNDEVERREHMSTHNHLEDRDSMLTTHHEQDAQDDRTALYFPGVEYWRPEPREEIRLFPARSASRSRAGLQHSKQTGPQDKFSRALPTIATALTSNKNSAQLRLPGSPPTSPSRVAAAAKGGKIDLVGEKFFGGRDVEDHRSTTTFDRTEQGDQGTMRDANSKKATQDQDHPLDAPLDAYERNRGTYVPPEFPSASEAGLGHHADRYSRQNSIGSTGSPSSSSSSGFSFAAAFTTGQASRTTPRGCGSSHKSYQHNSQSHDMNFCAPFPTSFYNSEGGTPTAAISTPTNVGHHIHSGINHLNPSDNIIRGKHLFRTGSEPDSWSWTSNHGSVPVTQIERLWRGIRNRYHRMPRLGQPDRSWPYPSAMPVGVSVDLEGGGSHPTESSPVSATGFCLGSLCKNACDCLKKTLGEPGLEGEPATGVACSDGEDADCLSV
ncbi:unnamed protein product [Amoebophrya sp. A120]|nr:unnamed protein product [Amoebophrya sp. A120]|eukprot:GSA120T00018754001.1